MVDENDNDPEFSRQKTTVYLDESSFTVDSTPLIRVKDNDFDENGRASLTSEYFDFSSAIEDEFYLTLKAPLTLPPNSTCNGLEVTVADTILAKDHGEPSRLQVQNLDFKDFREHSF